MGEVSPYRFSYSWPDTKFSEFCAVSRLRRRSSLYTMPLYCALPSAYSMRMPCCPKMFGSVRRRGNSTQVV